MKLSRWELNEIAARIRGGARSEFIAREYGVTRVYANYLIRKYTGKERKHEMA